MSELDKHIISLRDQWLDKLKAIADLRYDIEKINFEAKISIMDNVDSELTSNELGTMLKEFDYNRFNSDVVMSTLKKLCDSIFPADAEWRKHVYCVDINGGWSNIDKYEYTNNINELSVCNKGATCDGSDITLTFADMKSGKAFNVKVPVRENIWYDFARAPGYGMGKYVLYCVLDRHYIPSTNFDSVSNYTSTVVKVASVCKRQNLAKAIDAFMTGKLDEEIKDASNTDFYIDMLNRGYHSYKILSFSDEHNQWSSERLSRAEGLDCEMSPTDEMFSSVDEFWQEYNDNMDRTSHDRRIKNLIVD